jgi:hypothetical protein
MSPSLPSLLFAALVSLPWAPLASAVSLPPETEIQGSHEEKDGALVALAVGNPVTLSGPIAPQTPVFLLQGRLGPEGIRISLEDANSKFIPMGSSQLPMTLKPFDLKVGAIELPRHGISFSGGSRYFVRPNPAMLNPKMTELRVDEWRTMPDAAEYPFTLEMRPTGKGEIDIWMDGHYLRTFEWLGEAVRFKVDLRPGAAVQSISLEAARPPSHLLLPLLRLTSTEKRVEGRVEFDDPARVPEPFRNLNSTSVSGLEIAGLGQVRGLMFDDLQSAFWRRHVSNRLPGERLFSVPLATYWRARVLCAVDPGQDGVNRFTFRVTRYGPSRGSAMADTIVEVPLVDASGTPHAVQVGTVTLAGSEKPLPLWLVDVPVKNGLIQDLLVDDRKGTPNFGSDYRYLDIELMDPLARVNEADAFPPPMGLVQRSWVPTASDSKGTDYFRITDPPIASSVMVFGVLLEKSPASLVVRANTGFQVFYPGDEPEWIVGVKADAAGDYSVVWDFADMQGNIVTSGKKDLTLAAGADGEVKVPIQAPVGWYAVRFRLIQGQDELVDSRTSFVMLPPDTRKAGLESPYFGWWFAKNQGTDVKLSEAGPLLQRLGIRRAWLSPDMPESESLKYGLSKSTIEWGRPNGGKETLQSFGSHQKKLPEVIDQLEATIREELTKWPSLDRMNVFHESGDNGAPFPTEIWGEPARAEKKAFADENSPEALMQREAGEKVGGRRWSEEDQAAWKRSWPMRMEYLEAMAKMVREKFPRLKLQYGNNGNSLALVGEIFRQKFPRKYIDTIAIEDLGQTMTPESPVLGNIHSAWYLREVARKMGYGDVPITATTEWIGRMTERLGLEKQAEWKVRDGLIALAYGFDTISIGGLNDAGSGYYQSIWANGGLCFRYPTMAPKPAFLAVAMLTQVLDQAKFQRFVPTGSSVLHVQEFRRGDDWIYAIWTPRGTRETTLQFPESATRTLTSLYGKKSQVDGKTVALTAGTAVQYLSSKDQISSATAGVSAFPEDPRPPGEVETTIPLESLAEVAIVSDKTKEKKYFQREGDFELREVEDPEMGKCLELELKPTAPLKWDMEKEYVYLKLKNPVPTKAKNAGVWVKGNGSWGRLDIWKTRAWGPWADNSNLHFNWPAIGSLNFDGWNFITFPYYDWARENDRSSVNANVVQGLYLAMPRKTIHGVETVPVENLKIRFKSILLF